MPPALADDFFRLAHDDTTGKPLLHPRAVGIGLASALLGELVCGRRIGIHAGRVYLHDHTPPEDALAHATFAQLSAQRQYDGVRTWLGFLSRTASEDVAARLWRAGHLRPVTSRWPLRHAVTYVPTDTLVAVRPAIRLTGRLTRRERLDLVDAFLACLCAATGLDRRLLRDAPPPVREHTAGLVHGAPAPLRELLTHTVAAVGDAVLAYRT